MTTPDEQRAARLAVRRLSLSDFRCYGRLRLDTESRPVVLTGPNGAGKTNLLEALSFLAPGRGRRRATLADIARHGLEPGAPWAVSAVLDGDCGRVEIGTGREAGNERRVVRIDGQPALLKYAGEAPGMVAGVMQLNVQIPADAPSGPLSLQVKIGDNISQTGITVAVQ